MVPTGFRFCPTDEEVIEILHHKVSGNTTAMASFGFIVERKIYDFGPEDLQSPAFSPSSSVSEGVRINMNERYYYCKRESDSREVIGRGWWKATSHVKAISWAKGEVMGCKRPLTFHRFKQNNQRNRKDAVKTDWIMHEYSLQSIPTDWRLCKIMYKGKEKLKEYMISKEDMNITPMHLDFASEQPPLPVNNNYSDNNCWSNSDMMFDDDHQFAQLDAVSDQSFPDLWSWDSSF